LRPTCISQRGWALQRSRCAASSTSQGIQLTCPLTVPSALSSEGWGDDVPDGKVTDFRRAVQATAEATVAFAWVEWPDKATRDAAMKKMVEDPRMDPSTPGNPPMPFDGKRMIFGGFEQVVEVKA
jgi:uncharacterized protein YbaA (DUF1428 family)